jgi:hypothetical protein
MRRNRWSRVLFVLLCGGTLLQVTGCETALVSAFGQILLSVISSALLGTTV